MTDERTLAFLRELERTDETVAAELAGLDRLAHETEDVRERAAALAAFLERLPAERERARAASDDTRAELEARRDALARAEAELGEEERRGDGERLAAARRAERRTRDLVRMGERRLAASEADGERLEVKARDAARDSELVLARGAELAAALRERPGLAEGAGEAPASGLDDVARWATNARAALFVARGRLAAERDAVIRQANEVGAAVLGEPLSAQSAALVARRVEETRDR